VPQDPAGDVIRRPHAQEAFVRFEDLDLVAAIEPAELDGPDGITS
jgi:hypothetical protein